jgi:hypothetical protein
MKPLDYITWTIGDIAKDFGGKDPGAAGQETIFTFRHYTHCNASGWIGVCVLAASDCCGPRVCSQALDLLHDYGVS